MSEFYAPGRLNFLHAEQGTSITKLRAPSLRNGIHKEEISSPKLLAKALEAVIASDLLIRLAVTGFSGDLVTRFARDSLAMVAEMLPPGRLELIPVGRRERREYDETFRGLIRPDSPKSSLPFKEDEFLTTEQFYTKLRERPDFVHGIYDCIPTRDHYESAASFLAAFNGVMILEKPFVHPRDLSDAEQLLKKYPNRIMDVDFFSTSAPMFFLLATEQGQEILHQFGRPIVINGSMLETQLVDEKRGGKQNGLRSFDLNGGGIYMDMSPHLAHIVAVLMSQMNTKKVQRYEPRDASFYSYNGAHRPDPDIRETLGIVQHWYDGVLTNFQAGKGVGQDCYCVEMINQKGDLLFIDITIGSPRVVFHPVNGKAQVYTFSEAGNGYEFALARILTHILGRQNKIFPNNNTSSRAALEAVRQADDGWLKKPFAIEQVELGRMPGRSIPVAKMDAY